ncbi:MAG: hypothetical protein NVSMB23_26070 [Myxococcales bacterium]
MEHVDVADRPDGAQGFQVLVDGGEREGGDPLAHQPVELLRVGVRPRRGQRLEDRQPLVRDRQPARAAVRREGGRLGGDLLAGPRLVGAPAGPPAAPERSAANERRTPPDSSMLCP